MDIKLLFQRWHIVASKKKYDPLIESTKKTSSIKKNDKKNEKHIQHDCKKK